MLWVLLAAGVALMAWFLFAPRRIQTLENIKSVVHEDLKASNEVETTEDPREWDPIARAAAKKAGDIPPKGQGESLTKDWPNDPGNQ